MAAKIGILGESTVTTAGTTTVYTVPADKAARVQILAEMEGNDIVQYSVMMGTPGSEITMHRNIAPGDDVWTGVALVSTVDSTSALASALTGFQRVAAAIDISDVAGAFNWVATPYPFDYFLSTGDTVSFNINGGTATDHLFQVHGVEDDA